jgi:hypothetical protein
MRYLRFLAAAAACGVAVLLPYRARTAYGRVLAWAVHAPYVLFGRLARYLLAETSSGNPYRPG